MAPRRARPSLALAALARRRSRAASAPPPTCAAALDESDLQARLAARAASLLGQGPTPFQVAGERFNPDCSGFVEAVYAAEGIRLRRILQAAAPRETSAVAAAWEAAGRWGRALDDRGEWPAPGDLVFFDDTWDRNGNGRRDDPLTHLGRGRVGGPAGDGHLPPPRRPRRDPRPPRPRPARSGPAPPTGASSTRRCGCARGRDDGAPALAGQLFVGFGRIDPARSPATRSTQAHAAPAETRYSRMNLRGFSGMPLTRTS